MSVDFFNFLRKQVSVHYNEVADASAHNEEVEDLVASEVFMFVIENRYFQCINNTADCVDNTSCKQPSESGQRHIAENLCKCKDTRPSHSDIKNGETHFGKIPKKL